MIQTLSEPTLMHRAILYRDATARFVTHWVERIRGEFPPPPSWRECLRLAVPALIVGALIRLCLFVLVPETYLGLDSYSYIDAAKRFWVDGYDISFNEKRRFLYPVFLMLIAKVPLIAPVYLVSLIQHTIGVLTIIPFVYVARWILPNFKAGVILISLVFACWYKNINYENEVLPESIFLFFIISSVAASVALGGADKKRPLFLLLLFGALAVGTKPAAKLIWLGAIALSLLFAGNPLKWAKQAWAALVIGTAFFFTVGSDEQSSWLLLSSVLPAVPTEGEPHAEYREALEPYILEYREMGSLYPWFQRISKKQLTESKPKNGTTEEPVIDDSKWQKLLRGDRNKRIDVFKTFGGEGVRAAPFQFLGFAMTKTMVAFAYNDSTTNLIPEELASRQAELVDGAEIDNELKFELFYRGESEEYLDRLDQLEKRGGKTILVKFMERVGEVLPICVVDKDAYQVRLGWFGWLSLIGICASVAVHLRWGLIVLLPTMAMVFGTFAVGDKVSRYASGGEWLVLLGSACGLYWLIWVGMRLFLHGRQIWERYHPGV